MCKTNLCIRVSSPLRFSLVRNVSYIILSYIIIIIILFFSFQNHIFRKNTPWSPEVQVSSSSKCTSPPIPSPGWKAWARTPPAPSNGEKSPWAAGAETDLSSYSEGKLKHTSVSFTNKKAVVLFSDLPLRAKERTMSASPWSTLTKLSGVASLHIFRAKWKDLSTSSLLMSGLYCEILHAEIKTQNIRNSL